MRLVNFAYAQARIQARLAARPTPLDWQMVANSRDFAQAVDASRRGPYADAVTQLGRDSGREAIEAALRRAWAAMVAEVTAWAPATWRPALAWFALLPYLRLDTTGATPGQDWMQGFTERLPGDQRALLGTLAPLTGRFLEGPPNSPAHTAELAATLARLLRTHAQQPAAAFAWLGLVALDLESLRGALLLARLFPAAGTGDVR
jgi:hypothetical protein